MSEEKEAPLRLVKLSASNFLRLKAVEITPDGDVVTIAGRNGQGKTSILWAIESAIGGGKVLPDEPIRHGARKAKIVADLDEMVVERVFSAKGTQLVVKGKDGVPVPSPQKLLDKLFSRVSWDPLKFTSMEPKDQDALLKQVLGLDFAALDADRAALYSARTEHNRDAKRLEATLDTMPDVSDAPAKEVSVSEIVAEIERRQEAARANDEKRDELRKAREIKDSMVECLHSLHEEIAAIEQKLEQKRREFGEAERSRTEQEKTIAALTKDVAALVDPDVAELRAQIASAEETNRKVRERQRQAELEAQAKAAREKSEACTEAIESIDGQKAEKLAAAEFPVPGLGFDDTGPTLGGVPLEQASQAEKLRLSVAIGAALNPRLRVMLIRDGSLLDAESMRLLAELARETQSQLWVERVSEDGAGCSVVIEDGEVKASDEAAAE